MKKKISILVFILFYSLSLFSQSISSSPYSIFGLGSLYDSNFGPISGIGSSGIALPSQGFINNRNPASLAFINLNSFLFDFGAIGTQIIYKSDTDKQTRNNSQVSHLAFAFPINSKSGASVSLQPYSSATYQITNFKLPIENSDESYYLDANSEGGLNNFDLSYGYKISKKIALGVSTSVLFGNIDDNKYYSIANSITNINKVSYYSGVRFSIGNQFVVDPSFALAATVKFPAQIGATKKQSVTTNNSNDSQVIETDVVSDVEDYYLPLEIGVGFSKVFKNNLNLTLDYSRGFWNNTNQSSSYGDYSNQDKLALGFSYHKKKNSFYYYEKIQYSAGLFYDTGLLMINNQKVDNAGISFGLGLPFGGTKSVLNISYTYGQNGKIGNDLIKENYHKLGLNLSLEAIWFVKRNLINN